MKKIYYLYTHTRLDTNEVFYVGIGHTFKSGVYERAHVKNKQRRNKHWRNIVNLTNYRVDIIKEFDSHEECCQAETEMIKSLGRRINNTGSLVNLAPGGHIWKDASPVYQYDLEGNYIKEWSSAKQAANFLNVSYTNIYQACKINGRCKDFMFRLFKADKINKYSNKSYKKVYQFSKTGDFIAEYKSLTEASKATNTDIGLMSMVLNENIFTANGYIWSYDKCSCIVKRLILQKDKEGNIIGKYSSLLDVKSKLSLKSHNSIDNAIKGVVQKTAYGYYWESLENTKINTCED
jgi:hypothetical protein